MSVEKMNGKLTSVTRALKWKWAVTTLWKRTFSQAYMMSCEIGTNHKTSGTMTAKAWPQLGHAAGQWSQLHQQIYNRMAGQEKEGVAMAPSKHRPQCGWNAAEQTNACKPDGDWWLSCSVKVGEWTALYLDWRGVHSRECAGWRGVGCKTDPALLTWKRRRVRWPHAITGRWTWKQDKKMRFKIYHYSKGFVFIPFLCRQVQEQVLWSPNDKLQQVTFAAIINRCCNNRKWHKWRQVITSVTVKSNLYTASVTSVHHSTVLLSTAAQYKWNRHNLLKERTCFDETLSKKKPLSLKLWRLTT